MRSGWAGGGDHDAANEKTAGDFEAGRESRGALDVGLVFRSGALAKLVQRVAPLLACSWQTRPVDLPRVGHRAAAALTVSDLVPSCTERVQVCVVGLPSDEERAMEKRRGSRGSRGSRAGTGRC